MKTKVLLGIFISIATITISGCQTPNDVKEMVGFQQPAFLWIRANTQFSLKGTSFQNHENLTARLNKNYSLDLTTSQGKSVHIPFPNNLLERNGKLISHAETNTDYNTILFRLVQPQRQWTQDRTVTIPHYTTILNGKTVSYIYSGSTTTHYTDTYMDGEIEYRLAFYPVKSYIVKEPDAILYIKKPVKSFLMKSETVE